MDADKLLTPRANTASGLPEDTVSIDGVGEVRVRGLSRREATRVQKANGTDATERLILKLGMVEPELSDSQILQWQGVAPAGEIEKVSTRIAELSGLLTDATKSGVQDDGGEPGSGV